LLKLQEELNEIEAAHKDSNGVWQGKTLHDTGMRPEREDASIEPGQGALTSLCERAHAIARSLQLKLEPHERSASVNTQSTQATKESTGGIAGAFNKAAQYIKEGVDKAFGGEKSSKETQHEHGATSGKEHSSST